MNIVSSIKTCYSKYAVFQGTASRAEYWYFSLYAALLYGAVVLSEGLYGLFGVTIAIPIFQFIVLAAYFSTLIPMLSVGARRLHDTGRSGWWQLIFLVPVVGGLILFVMLMIKGRRSEYSDNSLTNEASYPGQSRTGLWASLVILMSLALSAGIFYTFNLLNSYAKVAAEISALTPYEQKILVLMRQIKSGELTLTKVTATGIVDSAAAGALPENAGLVVLPKSDADALEANETWWVDQENQLFIAIKNTQQPTITSVVFSIEKGDCHTNSPEKAYMNLNLSANPLESGAKKVYTAPLPFDYKAKHGEGDGNCGLIEVARSK